MEAPTDGIDLTSLFKGQVPAERSLYWYMPLYDLRWASTPAAIVRTGDWKLIHFFGDRFDHKGRYRPGAKSELFNLRDDIGEKNDQSGQHPQRVAEMKRELLEWIQSTGAPVPGKNPHFDARRALFETKEKPDWLRP